MADVVRPFEPDAFKPLWWARGAHAQTILGSFLPITRRVPYERVRRDTPDGDFFDIDVLEGDREKVVIMCHGLESSARAPATRRIVNAIRQSLGWSVYAINLRGRSGEANRTLRCYHLGFTDDVRMALDYALERGARDVYFAGFSLGGNIVIKLLAELAHHAKQKGVRAAMVFSVPFSSYVSSGKLRRAGLTKWLYGGMFLRTLKRRAAYLVRKNAAEARELGIDVRKIRATRSVSEFDAEFTCKVFGFSSTQDYYNSVDSKAVLHHVHVPLLVINSRDDPLIESSALPNDDDVCNAMVKLHFTETGGHGGFLAHVRGVTYPGSQLARFFRSIDDAVNPPSS